MWATSYPSSSSSSPISSRNSRSAASSASSPWLRAPPGMAHVPPRWQYSDRRARKNETVPSASVWRARMPAAPKRPHRREPSATVMKPSPEMPEVTGTKLRLVRSNDPHGEELGSAAVGVAEGAAGPLDPIGAPGGPPPPGRLGEPDHPRRADGVGRQHTARRVDRHVTGERCAAVVDHLPALALGREPEVLHPHRLVPAERHVDLGHVEIAAGVGDAGLGVQLG